MLDGLASAQLRQPAALRAAAWVVAIAGPVLLTLAALAPHSPLFRGGFQFSALVLVVAIAVVGGMRPALTALLLTMLGQALFFAPGFMTMMKMGAGLLPGAIALAGFAVAGAAVSKLTGKLAHLAAEQAAFQQVATLVAQAVPEHELFAAAAEEAGRLTGADYVRLGRYRSGQLVGVAAWRRTPGTFGAGGRLPLRRGLAGAVSRASPWAALEDLVDACGPLAHDARAHGVRSAAVHPIRVGGRPWGVLLAGSTMRRAPQACARRCGDSFADLLGAALSNAENLGALKASRARVLVAADEARRQIERDLHDGAQQRLVSLALALRTAQAAVPPMSGRLAEELASVADGLSSVLDDLRELARGIHPSVLSEGGLVPALKNLARRSIVPVRLDALAVARLPEPVEVAAYYVICEALANVAKHSNASLVQVGAEVAGDVLHLRVRDDGDGGADPARGSGLMGLKDRVEALGGTIAIYSPAGAGTHLVANLPIAA
ncbi:MAG TPA: GAF domain-containing sensor histidine kinase [Streptosporangiaceae bacterium]|nr:GAF domain-containing sensor histidine kinase [Streptosporangiaceae bacterium]